MNPLASSTIKVTIDDVARLAGVSIKTVSRVANGLPHVSDKTRVKVQTAIDSLGYTANPYAKYLGSIRPADTPKNAALEQQPERNLAIKTDGENQDIDWW